MRLSLTADYGHANNSAMTEPTDWQSLIAAILQTGLTQTEIGDLVGLSQTTISMLANGKQRAVDYDAGNAIKALHLIHCGPQAAKRRESLVRG